VVRKVALSALVILYCDVHHVLRPDAAIKLGKNLGILSEN
jgi:hypothetical protein